MEFKYRAEATTGKFAKQMPYKKPVGQKVSIAPIHNNLVVFGYIQHARAMNSRAAHLCKRAGQLSAFLRLEYRHG